MSEIDSTLVRPMEVHLLKICEEVIKLKYEESATNTKHLLNLCEFLFEEMKENSQVFEKLFESMEPAGSYPDNIKISEPDEYDQLIVLKFPSPRVVPSRSGYVTINISRDVMQTGWNIGKDNYQLFIDDEGYLIQNKVLNWIRDVVRSTLLQHDNVIETEEDRYQVIQSSNGPAVTLGVTVLDSENIQFSVDLVGCLAFHSDECWMSDVRRLSGVWNAIPKPIKLKEITMLQTQGLVAALNNIAENQQDQQISDNGNLPTLETGAGKAQKIVSENESKNSGKVKRPPSALQYEKRKSKVIGNVQAQTVDFPNNRNTRTRNTQYRRPKKPKVEEKVSEDVQLRKPFAVKRVDLPNIENIKWEKSTVNAKEKSSGGGIRHRKPGTWYYRRSKKIKNGETVSTDLKSKTPLVDEKFDLPTPKIRNSKWEKSTVNSQENTPDGRFQDRKSMNQKANDSVDHLARKTKASNVSKRNKRSTFMPNPQKNREWICSYAEIERQLLKGTQTMKPLIRIFKKIRDNQQLTNLKSYYIKTIFLHHNANNDNEYWQQSLAVLFMEMFDVILKHLHEHRLDSFWHRDFNLFRYFRSGQITAMYDKLLKVKKDLITNLENGNPEFIYEIICTDDERLLLNQFV